RKPESGTRGAICFQPIFQKRQPCFQLALQQQSRSAVDCSRRVPEGKTLIGRDPYLFFTSRFGFRTEAAVLMQPSAVMQGIFETERMIDLPGQRKRLAA